jgi:acetate kinase
VSAPSILVVNAGSSSLKLRLLDADDQVRLARDLDVDGSWEDGLRAFLADAPPPDVAGHRVVHGGSEFVAPVRVDVHLEEELERLADLAPLHNPPAIRAMRELHGLRPELPAVACFDTAFHATLPPEAATYAVPGAWAARWPLRRFGFHGLSHAYCARRAAELLDRPLSELRLVSAHLGAGASLAAVRGGRSVDTTMGFTPLEGLVMATRSGSLDPGLLLWVQRQGGIDAAEAERVLDSEAGLLGISGRSGDTRELEDAAEAGDRRSGLALDVYVHRLRASIAAMAASMGGLDALAFTGGVGEGSATIRARTCKRLEFLGLALDGDRNDEAGGLDREISASQATAAVLVLHAREDLEIAAQVRSLLSG